MHSVHATVIDPATGLALDDATNRVGLLHAAIPAPTTRCLRGAMGSAVAPDGTLAMQCQSCHGAMAAVGARDAHRLARRADLPELPHRHRAAEQRPDPLHDRLRRDRRARRVAADATFATNPTRPRPGFSLYRFSTGHGGLRARPATARPTPSTPRAHANDNLQSVALQGHVGMLAECSDVPRAARRAPSTAARTACTRSAASWVERHGDAAENGGQRRLPRLPRPRLPRHGALASPRRPRSFSTELGAGSFFRGAQVGCYACHAGPGDDDRTRNRRPTARDAAASTPAGAPVELVLVASDPDGNALLRRIIEQPAHGTVGVSGDGGRYSPSRASSAPTRSAGRPSTARSTRASPRERSRSAWQARRPASTA